MARLDDLDLSLKLSRQEEAERLDAAQERLLALRLALGGLIGDQGIGPPVCVALRGLGRERQGRRDQAPRRPARPAPRARRAVRGADLRREAPPLPVALLARAARAGAAWRCSTARGTGACSSSASRSSPPRRSGRAPTTRSTSSRRTLAAEGMMMIKFWMHVSDEEQLKRFEARSERPAEVVEADRRGLAQPQEAQAVHGGDRGHARAHGHRGGAVAPGRGRLEALGAREGRRDGLRADRSGCSSACGAPCAPASGRASSCARAPSRAGGGGARSGRGGGARPRRCAGPRAACCARRGRSTSR